MPKGVYSVEGRRKVWTEDDEFAVEEGLANGRTYAQIAKRLGRTANSVKVYCSRNVKVRPIRPLSARSVARQLGVPCSKTVTRWIECGYLRGRKGSLGAGRAKRWTVDEAALLDFLRNPDHWQRWGVERIADPMLREWAREIRSERYLTQSEVASRYFVVSGTVGAWLDRGVLPSVRNGNRFIRESDLVGFVPPSERSKKGQTRRPFTPAEDARLLALRNGGASWSECEYQLRRPLGSCVGRYARLNAVIAAEVGA